MNLNELIERLEEVRDATEKAGEMEIRLHTAGGMVETFRGVVGPEDFQESSDAYDDDFGPDKDAGANMVWLVSGGQPSRYDESPYAPGWILEVVTS